LIGLRPSPSPPRLSTSADEYSGNQKAAAADMSADAEGGASSSAEDDDGCRAADAATASTVSAFQKASSLQSQSPSRAPSSPLPVRLRDGAPLPPPSLRGCITGWFWCGCNAGRCAGLRPIEASAASSASIMRALGRRGRLLPEPSPPLTPLPTPPWRDDNDDDDVCTLRFGKAPRAVPVR